jgi:hypothetical protein
MDFSLPLWPIWLLHDLPLPFLYFKIPLPHAPLNHQTINNTIIMQTLPSIVSQYLTWPNNHQGLGLDVLNVSTPFYPQLLGITKDMTYIGPQVAYMEYQEIS